MRAPSRVHDGRAGCRGIPLGPLLPAPFDPFTACDVLGVIFSDYNRLDGTSAQAQGPVRIDHVRRWDVKGRTLLAATYYNGEAAVDEFICGMCRVEANLAILEQRGSSLVVIASVSTPWHPEKNIQALFDGRAEFDEATYDVGENESLLGIRTRWSIGMMGYWDQLELFRFDGEKVSKVFEEQVDWVAGGAMFGAADDDEVVSRVTPVARARGLANLQRTTGERRCRLDTSGDALSTVCDPPKPLSPSRFRFDGKQYRRIEGRAPPMPGITRHWK